ncbi:helix-turn-helix transcriptional regulator [bacterium]|nr:helix-turn-helix transcriptional regulator [bacterium]
MTVGKRIKKIKNVLNITSSALAKRLSIPLRTIGSYERDEAPPSEKFLNAMISQLHVNINWLLTGAGQMFVNSKDTDDLLYISKLQDKFSLSDDEIDGLIDVLECSASREMILRFIQIKKGDKEALDNLIYNLQGIKAIYG